LPVRISCALSRSTDVPYLSRSSPAAISSERVVASTASIMESGGIRRVAASGVGTPFGVSTVTRASPMPSEVSVFPTS
jgi:hypothetical protein